MHKKNWKTFFSFVLLLVIIDQFFKIFFMRTLEFGSSFSIFTLTKNTGTFYGLFKNGNLFFIFITVAVIIAVLLYYKGMEEKHKLPFALILAGGIGNLIDRVFLGGVIDFIDLKIWPIFNLADSFITIGILWLVWLLFLKEA